MSQNPLDPSSAKDARAEDEAPWFEAHWADMVEPPAALEQSAADHAAAAVQAKQGQPPALPTPNRAVRLAS